MKILDFLNTVENWESVITKDPYKITVKRDGQYILLLYNQLSSDMSLQEVQESRGSIFKYEKGEWVYVCRSFDKFFNYGETCAARIDWKSACVTEKIDGSLMKLWYDDYKWNLSTNGIIDAFKAKIGDDLSFGLLFEKAVGARIEEFAKDLDKDFTYLFELTSPFTQVIISYELKVWYLGCRNTKTGIEIFDQLYIPNTYLPKIFKLSNFNDVLKVVTAMSKDEEGVVVKDKFNNRIKVKSPEYLIAARLVNNNIITARRVLEMIRSDSLDDFLSYCPHHKDYVNSILKLYMDYAKYLEEEWFKFKPLLDINVGDKEFAEHIKKSKAKSYLFAKKRYSDLTPTLYLNSITMSALMRELKIKK